MADALPSFDIFYRCTFAYRRFSRLSGYINYQRETPQKRRSKIPQFGGCKFASGCMLVGANPVRSSARFSAGSSNRVIKQDKIAVLQKLNDCREISSGEKNLLTFCIAMHRREPIPPAASGFRVRGLLREALAFFSRPQCHNRPCGRIQTSIAAALGTLRGSGLTWYRYPRARCTRNMGLLPQGIFGYRLGPKDSPQLLNKGIAPSAHALRNRFIARSAEIAGRFCQAKKTY